MKKTLLIMVMALAVLLTQCRKPEVEFPSPVAPEGTTVSMTVTAGPGSKTDITTAGGITWSSGDKLYVGDGTKYVGYLTIVSGVGTPTGTFSGDVMLPTGTTVETFHFFYLGNAKDYSTELTKGTSATVNVSFAEQNIYNNGGKLENASKHHVGYGTASGTVKDGVVTGINVTLVSKVALARFSFKKGSTAYDGALTLSGTNIYNKMTVNFSGTFTGTSGSTEGGISLAAGHAERYVMLVPVGTESETLSFACDGFMGSTTLGSGIEANKFYGKSDAIAVSLHETVNFGTPDLNWSKYNLGVDPAKLTNAWDWYGDYYAWGEVVPYYTSLTWTSATTCTVNGWNTTATLGCGGQVNASKGYAWESYSHGSSSFKEWNVNPCTGSVPYDDDKKLKPERDAATQAWGGDWRMPTKEEWQSLYDYNTFKWLAAGVTDNETGFKAVAAGYLVVKGGKNSIALDASVYMFLPAAVNLDGASISTAGTVGRYWSSELGATGGAYSVQVESTSVNTGRNSLRKYGYSVRAVR